MSRVFQVFNEYFQSAQNELTSAQSSFLHPQTISSVSEAQWMYAPNPSENRFPNLVIYLYILITCLRVLKTLAKCRKNWYNFIVNAGFCLFNASFSCLMNPNRHISTYFDLSPTAQFSKRRTVMHTILLCDDNSDSLEGLSLALFKEPQFKVVARAYDGKTAIYIRRYILHPISGA